MQSCSSINHDLVLFPQKLKLCVCQFFYLVVADWVTLMRWPSCSFSRFLRRFSVYSPPKWQWLSTSKTTPRIPPNLDITSSQLTHFPLLFRLLHVANLEQARLPGTLHALAALASNPCVGCLPLLISWLLTKSALFNRRILEGC